MGLICWKFESLKINILLVYRLFGDLIQLKVDPKEGLIVS